MESIYKKMHEENLIEEDKFRYLESIHSNKVITLFSELNILLYLGIILLSTGVGYIAYQNLGRTGHLLFMSLIFAGIVLCFYFIRKHSKPYSNAEVSVALPYFDYILLLASLLMLGLMGYVQVYFDIVKLLLNWSTLTSAVVLFFMAYRYDNRALLSMGITALSAFWGISISPVDWIKGQWTPDTNLYHTGLIIGFILIAAGHFSYKLKIKSHFRFMYQNFGLILFFVSCVAAMADSKYPVVYALVLLASSALVIYFSWEYKEFLFFLYSSISGYIAASYLFIRMLSDSSYVLLMYYFPVTCIGYIMFLINKKSHFSHD